MSSTKQREILRDKKESFKNALTSNFDDLKMHSKEISVGAMVGGAVLLGGYLLYKLLSSNHQYEEIESSDKVVVVQARQESTLVRSIKQSIATFLLAIAKQKILEYIDQRTEEAEKSE